MSDESKEEVGRCDVKREDGGVDCIIIGRLNEGADSLWKWTWKMPRYSQYFWTGNTEHITRVQGKLQYGTM